jgi:hypothetical protein
MLMLSDSSKVCEQVHKRHLESALSFSTMNWDSDTHVENDISTEQAKVTPMSLVKDVECGTEPLVRRPTGAEHASRGGIRVCQVPTRPGDVRVQVSPACLASRRFKSHQFRRRAVDRLASNS